MEKGVKRFENLVASFFKIWMQKNKTKKDKSKSLKNNGKKTNSGGKEDERVC